MDPDYGDTNVTNPDEMQKLQNRALRKILFKKQQDSLRHFYKKLRILKFSDLLCPQNLILDEKQKSSKIWRQTTTTIKLNPEQKDFSI